MSSRPSRLREWRTVGSRLTTLMTGAALIVGTMAGAPVAGATVAHTAVASQDSTQSSTSCPAVPVPTAVAPAPTATRILGPSAMGDISVNGTQVAIAQPSLGQVTIMNTSANTQTTVAIPAADLSGYNIVLDASGNIYVRNGPYQVVKYAAGGQQLWTYNNNVPLGSGLFLIGSGANARIGAQLRDTASAVLLTGDGTSTGSIAIRGDNFGSVTGGYLAATDQGRYVRIYDSTGAPVQYFGDQAVNNDPNPSGGPLHFYQLGGAVRTPDGQYLATDTQAGIRLFSADGVLLGAVSPTDIDPLGLTQQSNIAIVGDNVYLTTGSRFTNTQYLVRVPLAQIIARATGTQSSDPSLGMGAGFDTGVADNYFPSGTPTVVHADFDPWWQSVASKFSLCWSVRDHDQMTSGQPGLTGWLAGNNWQFGSPGTTLPLPTALPPGGYVLDGTLVENGAAVSSTQMIFTVGAAGQTLSISGLPAGADWGGPQPLRSVDLAAELGTKTVRMQLDWNQLLSGGASAPLNFSAYDAPFEAASAEARKLGVTFIVQLGQGGPEKALVANGTWQQRVQQVVSHFADDVDVWEAWNEPNATFGSAADYVNQVLAPVYRAVKSVDPSKIVVGGSVVGTSLDYWRAIVAAGGLNYMDVASDHPYSGYNRSFEEQGSIAQLQALKALLVRNGQPIPLWITELAWWSDGAENLWAQADDSSRALLWMAALGIDKWAYFISEGGWGNDGVSFSAIQINDYVKPAALALMTTSGQLAGRPFLGQVSLDAPSTYALRFGPRPGDASSGDLLVAWTDGLRVPAALSPSSGSTPVITTDEFGGASTGTLTGPTPVVLDSSPSFFQSPAGSTLDIAPVEDFGRNVATRTAGATVTASSANSANPASNAIDGDPTADGAGALPGSPYWVSAPGDSRPTLTVTLAQPQTIDRVIVSTHSLGSVAPGVRDYTLAVQPSPGAPWTTVGTVQNEFYDQQELLTFPAQAVSAFQVSVSAVNLTGTYEDGHAPSWWPTDSASLAQANEPFYGPAVIGAVAAYAPGAVITFPSGSPGTPVTTPLPGAAVSISVAAPTSSLTGTSATVSVRVSGDVGSQHLVLAALRNNTAVATRAVASNTVTMAVPVSQTAAYTVRLTSTSGTVLAAKQLVITALRKTASRLSVRRHGARVTVSGSVRWASGSGRLGRVSAQLWVKRGGRWLYVGCKLTDAAGAVGFTVASRDTSGWQLRYGGRAVTGGYVSLASTSAVVRSL